MPRQQGRESAQGAPSTVNSEPISPTNSEAACTVAPHVRTRSMAALPFVSPAPGAALITIYNMAIVGCAVRNPCDRVRRSMRGRLYDRQADSLCCICWAEDMQLSYRRRKCAH